MTPPAWTAPEGWLIPLSAAAPLISHTLNRLHSGLHVYPPGGRQGSPCQSLRDCTNTKQESGVGRRLPESGQDENPGQSEQRPSSTRNGEPGSAKLGAHRERGGRSWGGFRLCCRVSWHVRRGPNGHRPGSEAARTLQAEQIALLSRGSESFQARKQDCTYVDLCTIEAVLVHHPVESHNRRQR